jgi:hypothetical protein
VLSDNPLMIEPEKIKDVRVLDLYLAGKKYKTIRRGAFGLLMTSVIRRLTRKDYL